MLKQLEEKQLKQEGCTPLYLPASVNSLSPFYPFHPSLFPFQLITFFPQVHDLAFLLVDCVCILHTGYPHVTKGPCLKSLFCLCPHNKRGISCVHLGSLFPLFFSISLYLLRAFLQLHPNDPRSKHGHICPPYGREDVSLFSTDVKWT